MDKMKKANKEMVDVLLQAQQESMKGFLELEKKRMEWQVEQAQKEEKEARFMSFMRDVFSMFAPPPSMPYYPPMQWYSCPPVPPLNPSLNTSMLPPIPQDEEEEDSEDRLAHTVRLYSTCYCCIAIVCAQTIRGLRFHGFRGMEHHPRIV